MTVFKRATELADRIGKDQARTCVPSIAATVGAGHPHAGRLPGIQTNVGGSAPQAQGSPLPRTGSHDTVNISVEGLQHQLGAIRAQIENVDGNANLCAQTKAQTLAPLYAEAEAVQSLISASRTTP